MRKLLSILALIIVCLNGIGQNVTQRASANVTVQDGRLMAQYNLFIPRFFDTTAANLKIGIDSCGAKIFTYKDNSEWLRACNPKRWVLTPNSSGNTNNIIVNNSDSTLIICYSDLHCDTLHFNVNIVYYTFINDSTAIACDTSLVCQLDTCLIELNCDTVHIPPIPSLFLISGLERKNNLGYQGVSTQTLDNPNGGPNSSWFQRPTTTNTFVFNHLETGFPVMQPVFQVFQQQEYALSSDIAAFLAQGLEIPEAFGYHNRNRYRIGYFGNLYSGGGSDTAIAWGYGGKNFSGYYTGTNIYAAAAGGIVVDDQKSKWGGMFIHDKDTATNDAIDFIASRPSNTQFIGGSLASDTTTLQNKKLLTLFTNKSIRAYGYGQNTFAATPATAAGWDANGNFVEFPASSSNTDSILGLNLTFEADKPYRFWQGVAVGSQGIFTFSDRDTAFALSNTIERYDFYGRLELTKRNAYTGLDSSGRFMSFGSANFDTDTTFLVTVYNFNSGGPNPYQSRVVRYSATTLNIKDDYPIGNGVAEGVFKYLGEFYVCYHNLMVIRKFDASFNFLTEYPLSRPIGPYGGYQSITFVGTDVYLNYHTANSYNLTYTPGLDHYTFNGSTFTFINNIVAPTYGSGQGMSIYGGKYYWSDRPRNAIVIIDSLGRRVDDYINPNYGNIVAEGITSHIYQNKPLNVYGYNYLSLGQSYPMQERLRIDGTPAIKMFGSIADITGSSTALVQINRGGTLPLTAVGQFLANTIYNTVHTRDTVTIANQSTIPLRQNQFQRYLNMGQSGINVSDKENTNITLVIQGNDTTHLSTSVTPVYTLKNSYTFQINGNFTGRNKVESGTSNLWDASTASLNALQTSNTSGGNWYRLFGYYSGVTSNIQLNTAADTIDNFAHYLLTKLGSGHALKKYGLLDPGVLDADSNWGVYVKSSVMNYMAGTLQIGDNGTSGQTFSQAIRASAALEINTTSRGFLQPRMTAAQRLAISSPATGLMVFDLDTLKPGWYNGSVWVFPASTTAAGSGGYFNPNQISTGNTNHDAFFKTFEVINLGYNAYTSGVSGRFSIKGMDSTQTFMQTETPTIRSVIGTDATTSTSIFYSFNKSSNKATIIKSYADSLLIANSTGGTPATINQFKLVTKLTLDNLSIKHDAIGAGSIVDISSISTAAASNLQKGLNIDMSGANATASQTTYGVYSSNTHTGTGNTNVGGKFISSGGVLNIGAWGDGTSSGLYGTSTSTGVLGEGNSIGVQGTSSAGGYGGSFSSTGGFGANIKSTDASTNTVFGVLEVERKTSGSVGDGIGGSIDFKNTTTVTEKISNQLISKWSTVADATRTSQFIITGVNSATTQNLLILDGNGQATLSQYTGTNFNTAQAKVAMVGTDGKVYAVDTTGLFGGGGAATLIVGTSAISSGTARRVLFEGTSNELQESANFVFNASDELLLNGVTDVGDAKVQLKIGTASQTGYYVDMAAADGQAISMLVDDQDYILNANDGVSKSLAIRNENSGIDFSIYTGNANLNLKALSGALNIITDGSNNINITSGGSTIFNSQTQYELQLKVKDISIPSTPASGYGDWYVNSDKAYMKSDGGIIMEMTNTVNNQTVNTTAVGNVGTGEDDLITYSVPAATLANDKDYLEFTMTFKLAANANNKQIKVYFGATQLYASTAQAQNDGSLTVRGRIIRTGATTQVASVEVNTDAALFTNVAKYTTPGETLSGAVTLKATGEGVSSDDISQKILTVQYVRAN